MNNKAKGIVARAEAILGPRATWPKTPCRFKEGDTVYWRFIHGPCTFQGITDDGRYHIVMGRGFAYAESCDVASEPLPVMIMPRKSDIEIHEENAIFRAAIVAIKENDGDLEIDDFIPDNGERYTVARCPAGCQAQGFEYIAPEHADNCPLKAALDLVKP